MNPSKQIENKVILEIATEVGLAVIGVSNAEPLLSQSARLKVWQDSGYCGEMGYMKRDADLFINPNKILPNVKSIISLALFYDQRERKELSKGFGKVARYAWGKDYHKVFRKRLKEFEVLIKKNHKNIDLRIVTDSIPFLERAVAKDSGLGFIGKNTLLITPGLGSFSLLAEIFVSKTIEPTENVNIKGECGSCSRCLISCPTKAFVSPYVLDARRCISYLTIEKRGILEIKEREFLGDWIFGCDVCQEVCPFNHTALKSKQKSLFEEFNYESGVGSEISLAELFTIRDDSRYLKLYSGTPLMRAKREGLIRNGIAVAVNSGWSDSKPLLEELFMEDDSPVVRAMALWGISKFSESSNSLESFLNKAFKDPDILVQAEASLIAYN